MPLRFLFRLLMLGLSFTLVGCSTGSLVKTYEGDTLPPEQVATLIAPENISLYSVNGEPVTKYLLSDIEVNYALKPGKNLVVFEYSSVWGAAAMGNKDKRKRSRSVESGKKEVLFDAAIGTTYTFSYPVPDSYSSAAELASDFRADVINMADQSVVASSVNLGVNAPAPAMAVVQTQTAHSSDAAANPAVMRDCVCQQGEETQKAESLAPLEGMKSYWQKASPQDKKAFMKWAFQ